MPTHSDYSVVKIFDNLPYHQKTAILSDAAIKTLTVPIDIIQPLGSDLVILPIIGSLYLNSLAGAYTVGEGTFLRTSLVWNDGSQLKEALSGQDEFEGGNFYQNAAEEFAFLLPTLFSASGTLYTPALDVAAVANQACALQIITDTGDLTDGNGDNTLRVSVGFHIWNYVTGEFVWN